MVKSEEVACCAHLHIKYDRAPIKRPTAYLDKWRCVDCDAEFVPVNRTNNSIRIFQHQSDAAARMECFEDAAGVVDRLVQNQRAELNGNPLTDGMYRGMKRAAYVIRAAAEHIGEAEEIHQRYAQAHSEMANSELPEVKHACDCWKHENQVCDICQGTGGRDKQKYRHDEWRHSVIEREECSCGVRLFQEKDGRIAELTNERDALLRDVHWLTMDKEGLRERAEVVGHELAEVRRERDELRSKVAGLEHALVEYIGTITDLGRKLGEANQREKVLRDRITHLEGILLAVELPQGQAYPATAPEAKS